MVEQLKFEFVDDRLTIGDWVKITAQPRKDQEPEDFYYLQQYTGKQGELIEIIKGKRTCFEIRFPNGDKGIFYEDEITKTKGGLSNEKTKRQTKETPKAAKRKKRND